MADQSGQPANAPVPAYVYSAEVAGLADRIVRFAREVQDAPSSSTNNVTAADQARWGSYLDAVDSYHDWIVSLPEQDLIKTDMTYSVDAFPELILVDNESAEDFYRFLQQMWRELVRSRSAAMPAGITKYDSARLRANTAKVRAFLQNYIAKTDPLDLPQSSPQFPHAPAGAQGI